MLRPGGLALAVAMFGLLASTPVRAELAPRARVIATQAARALQLGSRGRDVRALQRELARLSYLPATGVDGIFGTQTWHAVVALQGWSHLQRNGVVGAQTRSALAVASRPRPWSAANGIEIHIAEQVLLLVRNRRVQRAIHVSTGADGATPLGHFRIYRRDVMSWSVPFQVWMPLAQYFSGGYAMHEFASVPTYPASHGCVRIPQTESRAVWRFGTVGMRVWTRR